MKVSFVDLSAQDAPIRDELTQVVAEVMRDGNYILGHQVTDFEVAFAEYCGTDHAVGVSSGLAALELILRGYGIGPGDEVIVPAHTFVGTAAAVSLVGATPVPVDVDDDFTISPEAAAAAVNKRTKAVIAVHLYGRIAKMAKLLALSADNGLKLIEDAAQAHGATLGGQRAGSFGDAAAFSFYPSKNLGASGDAGAVTTNDPELVKRISAIRNCGQFEKNIHSLIPYNGRLDTLQAAILLVRLRLIEDWNSARRRVAVSYARALEGSGVVLPPQDHTERESAWHLYVVSSSDRDGLKAHLARHDIESAVHYPKPVHLQPFYATLGLGSGSFPKAETAAGSVLSLPMHPNISIQQIQYVADRVKEYSKANV